MSHSHKSSSFQRDAGDLALLLEWDWSKGIKELPTGFLGVQGESQPATLYLQCWALLGEVPDPGTCSFPEVHLHCTSVGSSRAPPVIKESPQGPYLQGLLTVHSFQPLGLQRPRALPSWNQAEALDKELPPIQEAEGQPSAPRLQLAGGLSSSP